MGRMTLTSGALPTVTVVLSPVSIPFLLPQLMHGQTEVCPAIRYGTLKTRIHISRDKTRNRPSQDSVVAVSAWGEEIQRRRCAGSMYFRQRKSSAINSLICLRKSRCAQRRSGAANPSLLLRSLTRSGIIPRTACLTAYLLHPSRTLRWSGNDTPYSTSL